MLEEGVTLVLYLLKLMYIKQVKKKLNRKCVICDRKKSMSVSDNTIAVEALGRYVKKLGRSSANAGKKLTKIFLDVF